MNKLDSTVLVIFGITGDLSRRYLLPALYHLCKDGLLPDKFIVLGTSRQELELDDFLSHVELCVLEQDNICDPQVLKQLSSSIRLVRFNPIAANDYHQLHDTLDELEQELGECLNRLYYLSIPPQIYASVIRHLGESGLNGSCVHGKALTRLVVEKPFGYDTTSAQELVDHTATWFGGQQVFRIDHYLAKETVQDILTFRKHNPDYEAHWNNQYIESIEIAAYESLDVQGRKFYDQIGALRDLIQSHLLQLLALTTMELPSKFTSELVHERKEKLLESLGQFPADKVAEQTVRCQYKNYPNEVDNADTTTETFAGLKFNIDTSRWQGVKIRIATGKALSAKQTYICITFKDGGQTNFRIQPEPGIEVREPQTAKTDFSEIDRSINHAGADAYERVIIDAIRGDQTLFATSREVMACWHFVQPILDEWSKQQPSMRYYEKGSNPEIFWSV